MGLNGGCIVLSSSKILFQSTYCGQYFCCVEGGRCYADHEVFQYFRFLFVVILPFIGFHIIQDLIVCHLNIDPIGFIKGNFDVRYVGSRILRSEEHTSELQSRENLVCRLLLEKKKKKYKHIKK